MSEHNAFAKIMEALTFGTVGQVKEDGSIGSIHLPQHCVGVIVAQAMRLRDEAARVSYENSVLRTEMRQLNDKVEAKGPPSAASEEPT